MAPIENEPKGWNENQQNHDTDLSDQENKEVKTPEIDNSGNDLSGNASGNVLEEEAVTDEDEIATDKGSKDPKGFMGDFAKPQHDE